MRPLICRFCNDSLFGNSNLCSFCRNELMKIRLHNARAVKKLLPATLTIEECLVTLEYFHRKCAYCRGEYEIIEHFIPIALGQKGTTFDNCVPSCKKCNKAKWDKSPELVLHERVFRRVQKYLVNCISTS